MTHISIGRTTVAFAFIAMLFVLGTLATPSNVRAEDLFADYSYGSNLFSDYSYDQNLFANYNYDQNLFADYSYDQNLFADHSYDQNLFADYNYDQNLFADHSYDRDLFADYSYDQNLFADHSYDRDLFADYNYDHGLLVTENHDYNLVTDTRYDHNTGTLVTDRAPQTGTLVTDYVTGPANTAPGTTQRTQTSGTSAVGTAIGGTQQVYSQACQCYTTIPSYGGGISSGLGLSFGIGGGYAPSYAQPYPTPSYPQYPQPQQPRPQQPVPQQPSNYTSNYCTGGSCNTSIVDNSINGSFNDYSINHSFNTPSTAVIYPVTPQPIVSYQIPSYTYPITNYYPGYTQGANCTISASPTSIANGQASILTWSSNGSSAWLSDGIGAVAANGSLAVRPNTTRTYVLTVNGIYGSNTCSVTIGVTSAPYVALSQIPYTGFDLGMIGNTIYWAGLAALALALSYLVLYFKGGAVAFAGSMFSRSTAVAHTAPAHEDHAEAPVAHVALPTHEAAGMKDTMTITRSADGTPRIVINRA